MNSTTKRISAVLALVALVGVVAPVVANAQAFRILNPPLGAGKAPHVAPPFTHWDLREMPGCGVPWIMGTSPVPDLNNNGGANDAADRGIAQAAFAAGFAIWDGIAPSQLDFNNVGPGAPAGGFVVDGFNTLSFSAAALAAGTNAAAVTVRNAVTGVIQEADIVFNSTGAVIPGFGIRLWVNFAHGAACWADLDFAPTGNWPTPADGDTDNNGNGVQELQVDLGSTAFHEIGHTLGLDHIAPLGGSHNVAANNIMEQFWTVGIGGTGSGNTNLTLGNADTDGVNFLYTPDLGDAPDPWMGVIGQYPSLVHDPGAGRMLNGTTLDGILTGAQHIFGIKPRQPARNFTYEWLGRFSASNVDGECGTNQVDLDFFDDGVTFAPNPPVWGRPLTVTTWMRYANDAFGNGHAYAADPLWANVWLDLNQDCIWGGGELILTGARSPASPGGANAVGVVTTSGTVLLPPLPPNPFEPMWLRARLDWDENVGITNNFDGTLAGPAGAAQFGEVEDYQFWCNPRYQQDWSPNTTGSPRPALCTVYVGQPGLDQTFSAIVDNNDCVQQLATWNENYDAVNDETIVDHFIPTQEIPPLVPVHTGRCRDPLDNVNAPVTQVRKYWQPEVGPPTLSDQIPVTLAEVCLLADKLRVVIGAPTDVIGGIISGSPGAWNDSIFVEVSYRVSPNLIPLEALSPCDPVYGPLPQIPVGAGWINPEEPFEFDLQLPFDIDVGEYLCVEVLSSWSVNGNVNAQIIEYTNIWGPPSSVDDPVTPPSKNLVLRGTNPFVPGTPVGFGLPTAGAVTLQVYDVAGRLVRELVGGDRYPAGDHRVDWDGRDRNGREVPSGMYFLRLYSNSEQVTRKFVILR